MKPIKINRGIGISIGEDAQVKGTLPNIDKLAYKSLDKTIPVNPASANPTPMGTPWEINSKNKTKIRMPLTSGDNSIKAISYFPSGL
jgi:hypothetical protein